MIFTDNSLPKGKKKQKKKPTTQPNIQCYKILVCERENKFLIYKE